MCATHQNPVKSVTTSTESGGAAYNKNTNINIVEQQIKPRTVYLPWASTDQGLSLERWPLVNRLPTVFPKDVQNF